MRMAGPLRRIAVSTGIAIGVMLFPASSASAHVHGITPLLRCGGDPSVTGANRTDATPAAAANGGPISGLIPSTVGDASLGFGDGGFDAPAPCPGQSD
jgi:hypothetical protein